MDNADIARHLERLADLLEIGGTDAFRVRAYRNAAETVRTWPRPLAELVRDDEDLTRLPHVGRAIARKIEVLVETGALPQLEAARAEVPEILADLAHQPGLGPRRVRLLHERLGVRSLADLERAVAEHRVAALPGFGEKTEHRVAEALERLRARDG